MQNTVQDRMKELLKELGINIREFSNKSRVPYRTVQDYLAGKNVPGGENLIKINTVFRVSIDWLLTGEGEMFLSGEASKPEARTPEVILKEMIISLLNDMDREKLNDVLRDIENKKLLNELLEERKNLKNAG